MKSQILERTYPGMLVRDRDRHAHGVPGTSDVDDLEHELPQDRRILYGENIHRYGRLPSSGRKTRNPSSRRAASRREDRCRSSRVRAIAPVEIAGGSIGARPLPSLRLPGSISSSKSPSRSSTSIEAVSTSNHVPRGQHLVPHLSQTRRHETARDPILDHAIDPKGIDQPDHLSARLQPHPAVDRRHRLARESRTRGPRRPLSTRSQITCCSAIAGPKLRCLLTMQKSPSTQASKARPSRQTLRRNALDMPTVSSPDSSNQASAAPKGLSI